jgi:hypothetical protein
MLITILGQTLTTVQGDRGARSLGEVHKTVEESKNRADMRFVEKILNSRFIPVLERQGFPVRGGKFVFPSTAESLKVDELVSLSDILPIPRSYLYDKYGIPIPENGEDIACRQPAAAPPPAPKDEKKPEEKPEKEKEELRDAGQTISLLERIFSFFVPAPTMRSGAAKTDFTGRLTATTTEAATLADDYSIDIDELLNEAIREVFEKKGDVLVSKPLFDITNNALQRGIDISLKEIEKANPAFVRRFRENTAVFSAFKNHQQTKEIASLLHDENGRLKPFSKFRKEALNLSKDYNVNWLRTEYNTAVRSARSATNMIRFRQAAHLYPNLEYIRTSSTHPRVAHLAYVGTILPVEHPWWSTHLPPSDWNCACSVRQTDKPATAVPDGEHQAPAFRNSPAETAEFVAISETAYYKHTEKRLREKVREEGLRLLRASEGEIIETYKGKKGGFLDIVRQNGNEREKNLRTYKYMADRGGKYTLLKETDIAGVKNPDAFNHVNGHFSDAKHPETANGKSAVQNSVRKASGQKVEEVIIWLDRDYLSSELHDGFRAALQDGRASGIQRIVLVRNGREPLSFDVAALRKKLFEK